MEDSEGMEGGEDLRFVAKVQMKEDSWLMRKVFEECRAEGLVWCKEVEDVLVKYGLRFGELGGYKEEIENVL